MCQKFIPTVVEPAPTSHSVDEGSYFPSRDSEIRSSNNLNDPQDFSSTSSTPTQSSPSPTSTSTTTSTGSGNSQAGNSQNGNSQRMPKQELQEELRTFPDDPNEDVSINFDEFFDLAVTKNQFLNSGSDTLNLFWGQFLMGLSLFLMLY